MKSSAAVYLMVAIAVISGILVLTGYFFPVLAGIRSMLLDWAMIFIAVLLLMGVVSLISTHWQKIAAAPITGSHSLVLLVSLIITLLIAAPSGPDSDWSLWLYDHVMIPIESSLLGIMAVFLVYACARLFNRRMNTYTMVFIAAVLAGLVGMLTIPGLDIVVVKDLITWLSNVWAVAGVRGILLGVALGTVATGLRILLGADRPYGG